MLKLTIRTVINPTSKGHICYQESLLSFFNFITLNIIHNTEIGVKYNIHMAESQYMSRIYKEYK